MMADINFEAGIYRAWIIMGINENLNSDIATDNEAFIEPKLLRSEEKLLNLMAEIIVKTLLNQLR